MAFKRFKQFLNETVGGTKSDYKMDYKTRQQGNYNFKATFSHIDKITKQRKLEELWFKSKMDALGYADKFKKEMEAGKQY